MNKERDKIYNELFEKQKQMITLKNEISKLKNVILDYRYSSGLTREVFGGIIPYDIQQEYYDAKIKLPKLQEEIYELDQHCKFLSTYLKETAEEQPTCNHIGQCALCGLRSPDGCKLVR